MPARATSPATRSSSARRSTQASKPAASKQGGIHDDIDQELRAWIRRHGKSGVMPSRGELIRSGSPQLASRIHHHGGSAAVARRNGLQVGARTSSRGSPVRATTRRR